MIALPPIFILFLAVMIGLAVWSAQKTGDHIEQLKAQGFTVSKDMNGNPRLLVDELEQRIAIVDSENIEQADFDMVSKVELKFDQGTQESTNFRIEISSMQFSSGVRSVVYENEWRAKQELATLQRMLGL